MVHQKINYVLILFLAVLLLAGCKKKSKEYTTVIWEVVNPVTNEPYTNMLVRLYEAKKKNNGIEYKVLFEGKTNQVGIAEFSFKANLTSGYWYKPEINYVLILFLAVLLLAGCKKKSKEYTTVIWEVVNPVTSEPYTNMLVRLYEAKKKNNGIEYKVLFENKIGKSGINTI